MIVVLELVVYQLLLVCLLEMLCKLSLAPLGPNEVGALNRAFILFFILLTIPRALSNEGLGLLSVPPRPTFDYLSDGGVIVAQTDKEFKVGAALLWLAVLIGLIDHTVQLLHQLYIDCVKKIWLL